MKRKLRVPNVHHPAKTWGVLRWLCVVVGVILAMVTAWLAFFEGVLHEPFAPVLLLPLGLSLGSLLLTLFASDRRLLKVLNFFAWLAD